MSFFEDILSVPGMREKETVRTYEFIEGSLKDLLHLPAHARPIILKALDDWLIKSDPQEITGNKRPLKRTVSGADWYLRKEKWRVLYRVERDEKRTNSLIVVVGEKFNTKLRVRGKVYAQWQSEA
ncbi:MAG: hypothetical protein A3G34_12710 [Candidatus Lindowbacteria bacterium RIFCSPLOWO2_12_FULL_62_27]|nr:MAG: hypothetical protein A3I06_15355 [Candidatus Lindowbacteria bacterium RIFCSPLOWO2_02_FULL_62_12]OGH62455.1 MAG: hypothetical protein A3G34_12710 [Candidatus Lindowbacteria bacterium RIFCSPLOWO2_12_FULL_62_27]